MSLPRMPLRSQDLWPLASGLLLACAYPLPDVALLAWVGLIPLILVAPRHPFRSGFLCGLAFFGFVLYWLNIVMTTYGRLHPFFSLVAYAILVAYLALFFGAATWASCRLREFKNLPLALTLPVVWVALEFVRSFLLTGFPWALLGYSQQQFDLLIQSADLLGVYGLSFLLVLSNATLAEVIAYRGLRRRSTRRALGVLVLLTAGALFYGKRRIDEFSGPPLAPLQVALIQGNIPQDLKWDPDFQNQTLDIYSRLSLGTAKSAAADLIVWPESATPFYYQEDSELSRRVDEVARQGGAHLLFGSPAFERRNREVRYLNSAFLLSPQGERLGRSDKIHLVPFGEYVPLASFLPFIEKLVVGIGDFSPGTVSPLPMNGLSLGTLVCFESIFPELARDYVESGAALLVNITNDAWFGRSSAPWQHLVMSRFRAVENRTWVVRAANTGISAIIDPAGTIRARSPLFEDAAISGAVGTAPGASLYRRTGDLLPLTCLFLSGFWLLGTRRKFR